MLTAGCFPINNLKNNSERIAIVIPARLASERLPNKVLLEIEGLPMIEHVRRRGLLNSFAVPVFVASGDDQILEVVEGYGGRGIKTLNYHSDGLSRVHEASSDLDFDHFIVLQGDEILALPSDIDQLIEAIMIAPEVKVWNQISSLSKHDELYDLSIVKCLIDNAEDIFSIFRLTPLTSSPDVQLKLVSKICGLFAISKTTLNEISQKANSRIQSAESIEQLKFIEYKFAIKSLRTAFNFPSINTLDDVSKVREVLTSTKFQREILDNVLSLTL
jgi:3-deoxy-manno-octulosonate cytidylyltransferase (CMP-KDO synthetase)